MNTLRACVLVAVTLMIGGCASSKRPLAPVAMVKASPAAEPVIVRLVSRHQTITITAGHGGALYTVIDASGKVLVSRATLEELRAGDPDIFQMIAPGAMVWAGM